MSLIWVAGAALWRLGPPEVGWGDLGAWLDRTEPEDVIVALVHLVVLATLAYLVVTAGAYTAASIVRAPVLLREVTAVTPIAIRRVIDTLLAIAVVAGPASLAAPAAAAPTQAAPPTVVYTPIPAGDVRTPMPADTAAAPARTYVVASGDSLWSIAESVVEGALPGATGSDIADYWRRLIEANIGHLQSGDPNVIFPGELLDLPE